MEIRKIGSGRRKYHLDTRNIGFHVWRYEQEAHLHRPGICRSPFPVQKNHILARHMVKVVRREDIDVQQNKEELCKIKLTLLVALTLQKIWVNIIEATPVHPAISAGFLSDHSITKQQNETNFIPLE